MSHKQTKVVLWSTPRSLSTVLMKCLSFVPNSALWFEPYMGAMYYGPEATCTPSSSPRLWKGHPGKDQETLARQIQLPEDVGYDVSKSTYKWCQEQLEAEYPGKSVVFVKEISCAISMRFDAIPRGYKHSFLIRNPLKVLPSWKKSHYLYEMDGPYEDYKIKDSKIPTPGYFFKESYDLYQHIVENYDANPIVIDADDLLMNPDHVLKAYCHSMDIPYTDNLLHWDSSDDVILQLHQLESFTNLDIAANSSKFLKPSKGPSREDLSEDDRRCVDFCMPYYEKLYEKRLIWG
ncbi:uncharacterized protein [Amphiura filiformis]|uniref:uncharacterized protein n=1 Tax=Amphiura filiformis TaxID=82378 RepID=UPI003B228DB3